MIKIKELQPRICFIGNINGAEMIIEKIQNNNAVIRDRKSGNVFTFGLEALRRCDITIGKKGEMNNDI